MSSITQFALSLDQRPRINTALRSLLAIFGGYAFAGLSAALLALILPLPRVDAVSAAMMISFVVYLLAAIWVFATSTLARAFGGLIVPAVIIGIWLSALPKGVAP